MKIFHKENDSVNLTLDFIFIFVILISLDSILTKNITSKHKDVGNNNSEIYKPKIL